MLRLNLPLVIKILFFSRQMTHQSSRAIWNTLSLRCSAQKCHVESVSQKSGNFKSSQMKPDKNLFEKPTPFWTGQEKIWIFLVFTGRQLIQAKLSGSVATQQK